MAEYGLLTTAEQLACKLAFNTTTSRINSPSILAFADVVAAAQLSSQLRDHELPAFQAIVRNLLRLEHRSGTVVEVTFNHFLALCAALKCQRISAEFMQSARSIFARSTADTVHSSYVRSAPPTTYVPFQGAAPHTDGPASTATAAAAAAVAAWPPRVTDGDVRALVSLVASAAGAPQAAGTAAAAAAAAALAGRPTTAPSAAPRTGLPPRPGTAAPSALPIAPLSQAAADALSRLCAAVAAALSLPFTRATFSPATPTALFDFVRGAVEACVARLAATAVESAAGRGVVAEVGAALGALAAQHGGVAPSALVANGTHTSSSGAGFHQVQHQHQQQQRPGTVTAGMGVHQPGATPAPAVAGGHAASLAPAQHAQLVMLQQHLVAQHSAIVEQHAHHKGGPHHVSDDAAAAMLAAVRAARVAVEGAMVSGDVATAAAAVAHAAAVMQSGGSTVTEAGRTPPADGVVAAQCDGRGGVVDAKVDGTLRSSRGADSADAAVTGGVDTDLLARQRALVAAAAAVCEGIEGAVGAVGAIRAGDEGPHGTDSLDASRHSRRSRRSGSVSGSRSGSVTSHTDRSDTPRSRASPHRDLTGPEQVLAALQDDAAAASTTLRSHSPSYGADGGTAAYDTASREPRHRVRAGETVLDVLLRHAAGGGDAAANTPGASRPPTAAAAAAAKAAGALHARHTRGGRRGAGGTVTPASSAAAAAVEVGTGDALRPGSATRPPRPGSASRPEGSTGARGGGVSGHRLGVGPGVAPSPSVASVVVSPHDDERDDRADHNGDAYPSQPLVGIAKYVPPPPTTSAIGDMATNVAKARTAAVAAAADAACVRTDAAMSAVHANRKAAAAPVVTTAFGRHFVRPPPALPSRGGSTGAVGRRSVPTGAGVGSTAHPATSRRSGSPRAVRGDSDLSDSSRDDAATRRRGWRDRDHRERELRVSTAGTAEVRDRDGHPDGGRSRRSRRHAAGSDGYNDDDAHGGEEDDRDGSAPLSPGAFVARLLAGVRAPKQDRPRRGADDRGGRGTVTDAVQRGDRGTEPPSAPRQRGTAADRLRSPDGRSRRDQLRDGDSSDSESDSSSDISSDSGSSSDDSWSSSDASSGDGSSDGRNGGRDSPSRRGRRRADGDRSGRDGRHRNHERQRHDVKDGVASSSRHRDRRRPSSSSSLSSSHSSSSSFTSSSDDSHHRQPRGARAQRGLDSASAASSCSLFDSSGASGVSSARDGPARPITVPLRPPYRRPGTADPTSAPIPRPPGSYRSGSARVDPTDAAGFAQGVLAANAAALRGRGAAQRGPGGGPPGRAASASGGAWGSVGSVRPPRPQTAMVGGSVPGGRPTGSAVGQQGRASAPRADANPGTTRVHVRPSSAPGALSPFRDGIDPASGGGGAAAARWPSVGGLYGGAGPLFGDEPGGPHGDAWDGVDEWAVGGVGGLGGALGGAAGAAPAGGRGDSVGGHDHGTRGGSVGRPLTAAGSGARAVVASRAGSRRGSVHPPAPPVAITSDHFRPRRGRKSERKRVKTLEKGWMGVAPSAPVGNLGGGAGGGIPIGVAPEEPKRGIRPVTAKMAAAAWDEAEALAALREDKRRRKGDARAAKAAKTSKKKERKRRRAEREVAAFFTMPTVSAL